MFIDLKEECDGWGLQRLLCLFAFGSEVQFLIGLSTLKKSVVMSYE